MERNALLGATSNEEHCKLQCLARPECEHTTSLNIWYVPIICTFKLHAFLDDSPILRDKSYDILF